VVVHGELLNLQDVIFPVKSAYLIGQRIKYALTRSPFLDFLGGIEIYLLGSKPVAIAEVEASFVREETRVVVINVAGLISLVGFTGLVYLRTQEPLILLVGGLIAVVSVIGSTMRKG